MRKILYLTGTRADFGLMQSTLARIHATDGLDLKLIVTGMHLSAEYGNTVSEIEASGLTIAERIETTHDTGSGAEMAIAIAHTLAGITQALETEKPDLLLLLGDRGEMLAGAIAAAHLNIHIAHIHGGETSGTVDEMLRHCISKLAHLHFVATARSSEVLRHLGERSESIHITGAPGLDGLTDIELPDRMEIAQQYGFDPAQPIALVLFHPVIQDADKAGEEMRAVMQAALECGAQILVLRPNADAGNRAIVSAIDLFAAQPMLQAITHLPRASFLAMMAHSDVMIGNSSSGIIEAASFGTPVVNIGTRQNLRERNSNVRDCSTNSEAITRCIKEALIGGRFPPANVYGDGQAGERIVQLLQNLPLTPDQLNKVLSYDL